MGRSFLEPKEWPLGAKGKQAAAAETQELKEKGPDVARGGRGGNGSRIKEECLILGMVGETPGRAMRLQ